MFVAVEAGLICWAHFSAGVSWTAIGLGLGGVTVAGVALFAYVALVGTPRAIRRHHALLQGVRGRQRRPARADGRGLLDEVVDSQSTPHQTAPLPSPSGASRAR